LTAASPREGHDGMDGVTQANREAWEAASHKHVREYDDLLAQAAAGAAQRRADELGLACRYVVGAVPGVPLADGVADLVYTGKGATLKATLGGLGDESAQVDDLFVRLRKDLRPSDWRSTADALVDRLCLPEVDDKALAGLKFSEALPRPLAEATLAVRLADLEHAGGVLGEACRFER
jgi:hypothetical protein